MPTQPLPKSNAQDHYAGRKGGGEYVIQPTILFHWLNYAALARDTGATVVVPIYPVAPQGTAGTVVPQMADLISSEIDQHGAENVSVYADSSGGGLAFSVVQELVRRGDPFLRNFIQLWAGDLDLTDPLVSPLYGLLAGLPPTAVYFGNLDVLSPDVLVLQDNVLATPDADFTFILRNGELHAWPGLWFLPEAQAVLPDIYQQLGIGSQA